MRSILRNFGLGVSSLLILMFFTFSIAQYDTPQNQQEGQATLEAPKNVEAELIEDEAALQEQEDETGITGEDTQEQAHQIRVTWDDVSEASQYKIYRAEVRGDMQSEMKSEKKDKKHDMETTQDKETRTQDKAKTQDWKDKEGQKFDRSKLEFSEVATIEETEFVDNYRGGAEVIQPGDEWQTPEGGPQEKDMQQTGMVSLVYYITAVDENGNESAPSEYAQVRIDLAQEQPTTLY